jgi:hypothetical protein
VDMKSGRLEGRTEESSFIMDEKSDQRAILPSVDQHHEIFAVVSCKLRTSRLGPPTLSMVDNIPRV